MIPIFYDFGHVGHDPAVLQVAGEYSEQYYVEVAKRGEILLAGVNEVVGMEMGQVQDWGLELILAVHDAGMIHLLQTAYSRFAAETGEARPIIPETYAVGWQPRYRTRSVHGELGRYCFDTSAPIFAGTWLAAYQSVQLALSAANAIRQGARLSYALCRPPGHHVHRDRYGGFCYLNNIAVAAHWLSQQGQRVAILDIDYHHGNGTQAIFYDRADVLFCSLHADPMDEYPYYWGFSDERGEGAGLGYNFNFPLPLGTTETEYVPALTAALAQIQQYQPQILLISLGFDTFTGDPTGKFQLQTESFYRIAQQIAQLKLPTLIVQEGGYRLDKLKQNVQAFFQGITPSPNPF